MTRRLNCICMEHNALFTAYFSDFLYRLYRSDFVVGIHDGYKAGILSNCISYLLGQNDSVFMHVEQGYLKALFFELFQRMKHGVMLKSG